MPVPIINQSNLEHSAADRQLQEMAKKMTRIKDELFTILAREKLTMAQSEQFIRVILPNMFQEKINQIVMHRMVDDVLREVTENLAKKS